MAKCPACGSTISHVDLKGPTIGNQVVGPLLPGWMAVCPNLGCQAVLGVVNDPEALASRVTQKLNKR